MRTRRRLPESLSSSAPSVVETAALVAAARTGDRDAFGVLYERYVRMVHGVLLASAQQDDVQDLVQDVFLRALRQLHAMRDPAAFGAWIATIARNEARMHHRAAKPTEDLSAQHPDPGADPDSAPHRLGTDDVLRALRAVPERYREPLMLRLVEQMGGEEIADKLGLTHGTVRVYLHHGLRLLREQLGAPHA